MFLLQTNLRGMSQLVCFPNRMLLNRLMHVRRIICLSMQQMASCTLITHITASRMTHTWHESAEERTPVSHFPTHTSHHHPPRRIHHKASLTSLSLSVYLFCGPKIYNLKKTTLATHSHTFVSAPRSIEVRAKCEILTKTLNPPKVVYPNKKRRDTQLARNYTISKTRMVWWLSTWPRRMAFVVHALRMKAKWNCIRATNKKWASTNNSRASDQVAHNITINNGRGGQERKEPPSKRSNTREKDTFY